MKYVEIATNQIVSVQDIRRAFPGSSIPDGADCTDFGYETLIETAQPPADRWCRVVEGAPANYTQTWVQQPMSSDEIVRDLTRAVDRHIDDVAKADGWDNRITCTMRAALPGSPWQAKGVAFGEWMDRCYAYCYQVLADVNSGARSVIPTEAELIAEIDLNNPMVWPA